MNATTANTSIRLATTKQAKFILSLLSQRERSPGFDARVRAGLDEGQVSSAKASEIIDYLLKRPETTKSKAGDIDLRPLEKFTSRKRVRVAVPGGDTQLKLMITFRKNGNIYVDDAAVYRHQNNYGFQPAGAMYRGDVKDALTKIVANPQDAITRYTEITGKCGCCGAPLEKKESVDRGIGPICAAKLGLI